MLIFKQQVNGDLLDLSTFRSTPRALVTRPALVLSACYKFSLVWWGSEMHGCCPSVQVHLPRRGRVWRQFAHGRRRYREIDQ